MSKELIKCTMCSLEKSPLEFNRNRARSNGLHAQCKECMKDNPKKKAKREHRNKLYEEAEKQGKLPCLQCEEILDKEMFYRKRMLTESDLSSKRAGYKNKCKTCADKISNAYRAENKDFLNKQYRENYWKDPEKFRQQTRNTRERLRNSPGYKEYLDENNRRRRESYYLKKDKYNATKREKYRKNPQKYIEASKPYIKKRQQKVRLLDDQEYYTVYHLKEKLPKKERVCWVSGETGAGVDHFIPVSIGMGGNKVDNCYHLSFSLNLEKHNKNPFEWIKLYYSDKINRPDYVAGFKRLVRHLASQNNLSTSEFKEYVYWCFDNPRTIEDLRRDNTPSIELWQRSREEINNE